MAPITPPSQPTGYDSPQSSYFILENLAQGAEFGLDTQHWTVDKFSGVKFLPPGLHFFIFAAAPRHTSSDPSGPPGPGSLGVRHGILRFFAPGETIFESWNAAAEGLESDRTRTRTRIAGSTVVETVADVDQIKKLDRSLAPYPAVPHWPPLVNFLSHRTLARVVGVDDQGSARVDALMASSADDNEVRESAQGGTGKTSWGKQRAPEQDDGAEEVIPPRADEDELLQFVEVTLKKSWPVGAIGAELSRWSLDKSWLLSTLAHTLGRDQAGVQEVLGELQLAFVLFTLLHNFSALAVYKTLLQAFCRSRALLLPPSAKPPSPAAAGAVPLLGLAALPMMAGFLQAVLAQLRFLPEDFFTVQMPSLDAFFLEELDLLHANLLDAQAAWSRDAKEGAGPRAVWKQCVDWWEEIRLLGTEKWGWQLGEVRRLKRSEAVVERAAKETGAGRGSKWDDSSDEDEPPAQAKQAKGENKRQEEDWDSYVDIEDLEEGEDAPVIVEM